MGRSEKAQELREFLTLAIKLRSFARHCDAADTGLYLAAAEALEHRAHILAFGAPPPVPRGKIDMIC